MISSNIILNSSSKTNAKVELYSGSTLVTTCTCNDRLQDFAVERVGQSGKFFGFGIIHKLSLNLIDLDRNLTITKENSFKVLLGVDDEFIRPYPIFYVEDVKRDENTNTISIVAYDKLYGASTWKFSDLTLNDSYTFMNLASKCALKLKISSVGKRDIPSGDTCFDTVVSAENPANFAGDENFRLIFDAIAEATQTIYYIDRGDSLVFRRLNKDGSHLLLITKDDYINLTSGETSTLSAICHATELGDNITATSETVTGITQYIRDNPLYELRNDTATLLDNAVAHTAGTQNTQFSCYWFGNFLLEPGDKVAIVTEDDDVIYAYALRDVIAYGGVLDETTEWSYEENKSETESNPTSLGEKITQTVARVDKANKRIELLVSEDGEVGQLVLKQDEIAATVESLKDNTEALGQELSQTRLQLEADGAEITVIKQQLEEGADAVVTKENKFRFDDEGLTISKSDADVSTNIDNEGLTVSQSSTEVLTAKKDGVNALNINVRQYLLVGGSRFEAYQYNRTGCFWIGG